MVKALATKNVVAVLTAVALTIGISFTFAAPAKADTISSLQAQVQALLAQIQSLQGTSSTGSGSMMSSAGCYTFTQNLKMGATGGQVMWVQQFLNNHGFTVAASGAGSPGNETSFFGPATMKAVVAFQNANASAILAPVGLTTGNGNWYAGTRAQANAMCAGSTTGSTGTGTGTTSYGPGITVSAGVQPANSLAPALANRVPFTTFTLTNNSGAAVTISGITVQRTGLAADAAFAGVELLDQNGIQLGTSRTFNSNHQAVIGTPWTLNAGQSATYTVAGNMGTATVEAGYAGQVAGVTVVGVNTTVPVSGSLPISGAQQTINSTLTIGTATAISSSYDPNSYRTQSIGTTGITFSAVRLTAGSAEDEKLYSVTWNQTGSAGTTDIGNLMTVVNGTSYPVTADSTGKYYTSTFPGGVLVPKGNTVDVYIKGDLTGNNGAARTVEFDIYRASDIYLVGQTYGYGVTPTATAAGSLLTGNHASEYFTSPFFQGSLLLVNPGQLSTISNAGSVASQNIAINVPNQPLGGFTTNFSGEPVQVQSLTIHVASSTAGIPLTNVSLVDSNGNTVAGPVDETVSTGAIVFNTSVTFPVGPMTYTLKGTVGSTATNGVTFQMSTNPLSDWTNAQGQTSGSSVTLTNSSISMSVMTVQGPSLIISAASSPASTLVAKGAQNYVFANINLDASQSGENIRLSSLPITVTTQSTDATDLSSCQLWNGTTPLNTGGNVVNSSTWSTNEANFVFDNALTIPKGTVVTLSLMCNLASSPAGTSWAAGIASTPAPSPTGVGSGITLTTSTPNTDLVLQVGTSGTMSSGTASLAITNPSPLSFANVAGGTTGVTVGTFTLQPTSDSINLQKIGLSLNSNLASSSDVTRAYIYNGATQIGSVIFTGSPVGGKYYATSTLSSSLNLAQNSQTILTIKADIAQIGAGQAGADGHEVLINVADANGSGAASGATVDSGPLAASAQTGVAIFRSTPTVALSSYLPSNGISDGRLIAFTITAGSNGPIGLNQLTFSISTSSITTLSGLNLYAYTDSGFSQAAGGTVGGIAGSTAYVGATQYATTTMSTPLQIAAGTTEYFLLKGTVSPNGTTYNIATTLMGDSANLALGQNVDLASMYTVTGIAATSSRMIWSPNATTTALTTTNDWTNGFSVNGLPQSGLVENRTN
ncbi:MAG TPA: peptidoglycan-binding domain-containing protein [Candidatus Paceibacterota bacterium]|nr:peptidoglycan-binding domain-containing protein [Candidatus Paceibacterota bacterium]